MQDSLKPAEGFPRRFGSYVLLNAFAHGGMGEVYLAKHGGIEGIDRLCVLKKLRPDFTQNEEYVRRFIDEARVVVQLNHANICHVFDVGRVGSEYYLAMEYVSGVNVRALGHRAQERGQRLPENVALYIASEVLEALDYAHRHAHPLTGKPLHLVHRDVSPQNVMVNYEGEVKLIDFGLAASDLKEEQTESQVVMGKVAYMSPEQARGEKVTPHTDQFAAGIVAYELVVGERFYGEMNNYQIWQVVGRGGFTPPKWDTLSPELQALLARALHGDPKKRFPTCGDFKDALLTYVVARHPTTSKRTVRALMRDLFEDDTQRERSFLSRFADVSAASLQAGTEPEKRSVSLLLPAAGDAAAGDDVDAQGPGDATEVVRRRHQTESTATYVLQKRMFERQRRLRLVAAAAGLAVTGAVGGYLAMRSFSDAPAPKITATSAAASTTPAPVDVEDKPIEDTPVDDKPVDDKPVGPGADAAALKPAPKTSVAAAGESRRPPRGRAKGRRGHGEKAAAAEPAKAAPKDEMPEASDRAAWRAAALKRLQRCSEPCAETLRAHLPSRPPESLDETAVWSVNECLARCK